MTGGRDVVNGDDAARAAGVTGGAVGTACAGDPAGIDGGGASGPRDAGGAGAAAADGTAAGPDVVAAVAPGPLVAGRRGADGPDVAVMGGGVVGGPPLDALDVPDGVAGLGADGGGAGGAGAGAGEADPAGGPAAGREPVPVPGW